MRQQIDCAVLRLEAHRVWLEEVLLHAAPALARVRLHQLEWEAGQDLEIRAGELVTLPVQALAQAGVSLRRFDLCLVPVSLDTLAWTRQALALIPRGPFLPLVGIFQELKSAAMQDLLELGIADFVRLPLCPDEFRARVLTTVARVPRPGTLREPEAAYADSAWGTAQSKMPTHSVANANMPAKQALKPTQHGAQALHSAFSHSMTKLNSNGVTQRHNRLAALASNLQESRAVAPGSFREAKSLLVSQFERDYITHALDKHNGNIAMAARASQKHRRAFWALMRKYDIEAQAYRADDEQE